MYLNPNRYLYTGHVDIINKTGVEILNIMISSDNFKLSQLSQVAKEFFIENYQQFLQADPVGILQIVYCHQIFNDFQDLCLIKICFEPKILFDSAKLIIYPPLYWRLS